MSDDGRVDVTAEEAWPQRAAPLRQFTAAQIAEACVALATCTTLPGTKSELAGPKGGILRAAFQESCVQGGSDVLFGTNRAERAIPFTRDESWQFLVGGALEARGDCERIGELVSREQAGYFGCQEDGCYVDRPTTVTCNGNVARIVLQGGETHVRDCSRSDTQCSEASPTGCTDRLFTRCSGGKDRCDGDIKLGCDSCGFVSFHDCSWDGGHCEETEDGAQCVPPGAGCAKEVTHCDGSKLTICAAGERAEVDCDAIGMGACEDQSYSVDVCTSAIRYCTQAVCKLPAGH